MGVLSRLKHSWTAFREETYRDASYAGGYSYGTRQDRSRLTYSNERSIISSIFTRLSIDVAGMDIRHVRLDNERRYLSDMTSGLNDCLTVEANLDQAARHFRQDIALTLFNSTTAAVVPVVTTMDPTNTGSFDIQSMRVGEIKAWYPDKVRVEVYNERKGLREEITLPKRVVAIIENPLAEIMNGPNSTLQRLIAKLNMLDAIDEQSSSGKMDMIIQLPYVIKSEARREQAMQRRTDLEAQLKGSQYGVAYIDGTEKITQLNRPAENNLLAQVQYLTDMLYAQLGLTPEVMNGTADEKTMLNYQNRTIKPLLDAIVEAMRRTFLTKTARTQGQWITYFRDPFALVPMEQLAEIADKFTRNEILTGNEIRQGIGFRPSKDPKADKLQNSNMPAPSDTSALAPANSDQVFRPALTNKQPLAIESGGNSQNGT